MGRLRATAAAIPLPIVKTGQGFGWGLGIAADFDLGGNRVTGPQIDTASIVRVTDTYPAMSVSASCWKHITSRSRGRPGLRVRVADRAGLMQKFQPNL